MRVVRDEHVAGGEVLGAVLPHRLRHLLGHRAEVDRLREPLGDRAQLRVEERAREVGARLDVRRVGAALQRERHLVGRCDERVPDHLERDRVYAPPVHLSSALGADLSLAHVTRDELAVALLRRPVAAAPAGAVADDVARLELDGSLGREPTLLAAADQDVLGRLPGEAAERARRPRERAVGQDGEGRRPVEEEVLAQPEAAAEASRPLGVLHEREASDPHRIVQLGLLDRRVLGVLAVRLHRVRPVAREAAAVAAAERLQEAVVLVRPRVDAAEAGVAHHRLRPRGQPLGQRGEERAEDHVDEPRLRLPAADDGARPGAVRHRPGRCVEVDDAIEAVVDGQVRVDQALDRIGAGGERLRIGGVDGRAALRVGAGQVERRRRRP